MQGVIDDIEPQRHKDGKLWDQKVFWATRNGQQKMKCPCNFCWCTSRLRLISIVKDH